MKIQNECFTIGHSNHSIENFLQLLKSWKIEYLIDIRSAPYSKHAKQFNKEDLEKKMRENGIQYRYLGKRVGGGIIRFHISSQEIPNLKKIRNNEQFQYGIKVLHNFVLKQKRIALMCSESDPFICHRFFLVSYSLQEKGVRIKHILYDGNIIDNKVLEKKLKDFNSQKNLENFDQNEMSIDDLYEQHCLKIFKKFS